MILAVRQRPGCLANPNPVPNPDRLDSQLEMEGLVSQTILSEFEEHAKRLKDAERNRKSAMVYKNVVEDDEEREALSIVETLGKRQPQDVYDGDVNPRTLRSLLKMIDERGWERYVKPC